MAHPRFGQVSERPGTPVSKEGADMVFSRYHHAAALAEGKRVLEIACGAGQGLGLMGTRATSVVGGDIDAELLGEAKAHYGNRFPLARIDAQALPFRDGAFDLVLFFEASYYVRDMSAALDEIARVVAPGGAVTFVNANPERPDFIRSPHSHRYHTADEFRAELGVRGFDVTVEGTYPVERGGPADKVVVVARRILERLGMTPGTLRARAMVKRLIYGRLDVLPAELGPDSGTPAERAPHGPGPMRGCKVIYVTARRPTGPA